MSPEQWQRVQQIFLQAEELQGSERLVLLDRACAGDAGLRQQVQSMLAASLHTGDFLQMAVGAAAAGFVTSLDAAPAGKTTRPYRILRQLGSGAMGAVYRATRAH